MADTLQELLDDDGENRALRSFLMQYGLPGLTVGKMRDHMKRSGWGSEYWPFFVSASNRDAHLSKGGAQLWIRHLLGMEVASRPAEVDDEGLPDLPREVGYLYSTSGDIHFSTSLQIAKFGRESYEASVAEDPDMQHEEPEPVFTAEQYRQGQRDAVAADRARIDWTEISDAITEAYNYAHSIKDWDAAKYWRELREQLDQWASPSHTTNKEK